MWGCACWCDGAHSSLHGSHGPSVEVVFERFVGSAELQRLPRGREGGLTAEVWLLESTPWISDALDPGVHQPRRGRWYPACKVPGVADHWVCVDTAIAPNGIRSVFPHRRICVSILVHDVSSRICVSHLGFTLGFRTCLVHEVSSACTFAVLSPVWPGTGRDLAALRLNPDEYKTLPPWHVRWCPLFCIGHEIGAFVISRPA